MTAIQLRAFNLVEGAAILGTPTSPLSLQTGRTYVVVEVDRDADREVVAAQLRPLDPSIHGPFQQRFDYCEPVELVGLVVNAADPDDDDTGAEAARPGLAVACAYDTTRTSPFGYYGVCACGWITPDYWPTAQAAYLSVRDHVAAPVED